MNNSFGIDTPPGLNQFTPDTAQLLVLNGPGTNSRFPLNLMKTTIGRNDPPNIQADIDLTDCEIGNPPVVSRRHAEIEWVGGNLQIVDLGSSNGTFVDGEKLSPVTPNQPSSAVSLKPGSRVKLGNLEFEVIINE